MKLTRTTMALAVLFFATTVAAQDQGGGLVEQVFARLLAAPGTVQPQSKYSAWPPQVGIATQSSGDPVQQTMKLNAFASAPDCRPHVTITQGLLDEVVQGDPDRLALILGHELGHLILGHPVCSSTKEKTSTLELALTREQEYAADAKGYELAFQSGFSVRNGLRGMQRLEQISHYSSFEGLSVDHPSWTDRLARLDKEQAPIWRSMSAFNDGTYFLAAEDYDLAARCFRAVVREFPQTSEAIGNLGYALLMQYIDKLSENDIRRMEIGQLATGSFYSESIHLKSKIRGINASLWLEAVQLLKQAEALNPNLSLVKANLGLAYLVQPTGSDPQTAAHYLQTAGQMLKADAALQGQSEGNFNLAVVAVATNLAVADLAAGNRPEAEAILKPLWQAQGTVKDEQAYLQRSALYYNVGMMLAGSATPDERQQGANMLDGYLRRSPADSAWWQLAYQKFTEVCSSLQEGCVSEQQLKTDHASPMRQVDFVRLPGGKTLSLGQPLSNVYAEIGKGQEISAVSGANVHRLRYPQFSLDILVTDVVVAVLLRGTSAPTIPVQRVGLATTNSVIRYGMTADELENVLADQPYQYQGLIDTWVPYRFYPGLGIAVLVGTNKMVDELVMVRSSMN